MEIVSVLGRAGVGAPGAVRPLRSGHRRRLLATLALHHPSSVGSDRVREWVWGADAPGDPTAALHTLASRLRGDLEGVAAVRAEDGAYRLDCPTDVLDTHRFARGESGAPDPATSEEAALAWLGTVEGALALWRGEPFEDLEVPEAVAERMRLGEIRSQLRERRCDVLVELGRVEEAEAELGLLLDAEPTREDTAARLMRAHWLAGRQVDALAVYTRVRHVLADELGLEPGPELRRMEAAVLAHDAAALGVRGGWRTGAPPATDVPDAAGAPDPSPRPTDSGGGGEQAPLGTGRDASQEGGEGDAPTLVGRSDDIAAVTAALQRSRLVTITGPGGVGKTSLARQVASELCGRIRCLVVELTDDGTDRPGLAGLLGAALRLPVAAAETGAGAVGDRLAAALDAEESLVVVDNCEVAVEPLAGEVASLLAGTTRVSLLLTGREPLGISEEVLWPLEGLGAADAALLFTRHADRVQPRWREATVGDPRDEVARLCRRLDGLPLAIELAAQRLRVEDLDSIAAGLEHRVDLLSAGRRDLPARHLSLDALVEWSWRGLDRERQEALMAMSAFAGTFARDDAMALIGGDPAEAAAALDALVVGSLVARSAGGRYRLLDTIRSFAQRRVGDRDDELRNRHRAWLVGLARQADRGLRGPEELRWADRLRDSLADVRVVERALRAADPESHARLVTDLVTWASQASRPEVLDWADAAWRRLSRGEDLDRAMPRDRRAALAASACIAVSRRGELGVAATLGGTAVALSDGGPPRSAALCHFALADVELFVGELDAAARHAELSHSAAQAAEDPLMACLAAVDVALARAYAGLPDPALEWCDEAMAVADECSAPGALAWAHYARGEVVAPTDPDAALVHLEEALRVADPDHHAFLVGVCGLTRADAIARLGDLERSLDLFAEVLARWRTDRVWAQAWTGLRSLAELLLRAGDAAAAGDLVAAIRGSSSSAPLFGDDERRMAALEVELDRELGPDRPAPLDGDRPASEVLDGAIAALDRLRGPAPAEPGQADGSPA